MEYNILPLKSLVAVNELVSVYFYVYAPNYKFPGESHNFYEFVFCNSGEVEILADTHLFTLNPSQAFLHYPNEFHKISNQNAVSSALIISFNTDDHAFMKDLSHQVINLNATQKVLLSKILKDGSALLKGNNHSTLWYPKPSENLQENGYAHFLSLQEEDTLVTEDTPQTIKNNIELFLLSCYRQLVSTRSTKDESTSKHQDQLINQVIDYLKETLAQRTTLEDISAKFSYTNSYLSRLFKKVTGYSIIEYKIILKIKKAVMLMTTGKHTIKEISEQLGFDSLQYFNRQFKKITHMSPTAYVRSIKVDQLISPHHTILN